MAAPPGANGPAVQSNTTTAGEPGIAAVVAMLQSETGPPRDDTCTGDDQVELAGASDATSTRAAQSTQVKLRRSSNVQLPSFASRRRTIGDAIIAELDLEDLQAKRRRLVQLSRDVLEARCPGFCARATMSEVEYLCEASYALAYISNDVEEAARAVAAVRVALRAMTPETNAVSR